MSFEYNIRIYTIALHFGATKQTSRTSSQSNIGETHQVKVEHTHHPTAKLNIENTQRKQKTTHNQHIMTNIINHNGCKITQIKTQNERISYISELEKRDN